MPKRRVTKLSNQYFVGLQKENPKILAKMIDHNQGDNSVLLVLVINMMEIEMAKTIIKFDDAVDQYLACYYKRGEAFNEEPEAEVVDYTKEVFDVLYYRRGYIESITPVYSPSHELTIVIYLKLEDKEAFEKFEELNKAGWNQVEEKHELDEYWFWRFVNGLRDDAGHLIKVWPCDSNRNEFAMVIKESF